MGTSAALGEASPLVDRRKEARFTLILRVGVLEQAGKSSFCLVKNISATGLQLKVYTRPEAGAPASIRIADEPPVHGRLIWVRNDTAGISFHEELDPATLLRVRQKLRPNRRRAMPRVAVRASATVRCGGLTQRASVSDISSVGARLETRSPLTPGDKAMITFEDLPTIRAFVRWSDSEESGLAFETPIPMQIIASWIDDRIRLSA